MIKYDESFYSDQQEGSRKSALEVVPLLLNFIKPRSVVDVGCGVGTWASVFREYGITDILGIDGDYINLAMLQIPQDSFLSHDLSKPLLIEKKFDLVLSLEVAEHIEESKSRVFIENLTNLGSIIVFSAAIPEQGGTNHINEKWPEYWQDLFKEKGYVVIDCIRDKIWNNEEIECCYVQNILIYVKESELNKYPLISPFYKENDSMLSIVHPRLYILKAKKEISLGQLFWDFKLLIKKYTGIDIKKIRCRS